MKTKPKQQVTLISDDIKEIHRLTDTLLPACRELDRIEVTSIMADINMRCVDIEKKIYLVVAMLENG